MTFVEACRAILADPKTDPYAQGYARVGLGIALHLCPDRNAIRTQALYILTNLSRWRSPQAKEVRAVLKQIGEAE